MPTISKTFRLQEDTVNALQELVEVGLAVSQTALLEWLIRREKARLQVKTEEETLAKEWAEAMQDADFVADLHEVEASFRSADQESSGMIQ